MTTIKQVFLATVCSGKEGNICAIWPLVLEWFLISLKSRRLVAASGRYESTQQLKKSDCKYVMIKRQHFHFIWKSVICSGISMLLQYLTSAQKPLRILFLLLIALNQGKFSFYRGKKEKQKNNLKDFPWCRIYKEQNLKCLEPTPVL